MQQHIVLSIVRDGPLARCREPALVNSVLDIGHSSVSVLLVPPPAAAFIDLDTVDTDRHAACDSRRAAGSI